jgi:hypothetical protein
MLTLHEGRYVCTSASLCRIEKEKEKSERKEDAPCRYGEKCRDKAKCRYTHAPESMLFDSSCYPNNLHYSTYFPQFSFFSFGTPTHGQHNGQHNSSTHGQDSTGYFPYFPSFAYDFIPSSLPENLYPIYNDNSTHEQNYYSTHEQNYYSTHEQNFNLFFIDNFIQSDSTHEREPCPQQ